MINKSHNNNIKCIQINLQRSKHATANLIKIIKEQAIDLVLIQEPYVIGQKVCGFPLNYKTIFCDTGEKPKTAIIIVNNNLQGIKISSFTTHYSTFVSIQFKSNSIIFNSTYCSPANDIKSELNQLNKFIEQLNARNIVISIDSNAHSQVWFNSFDDSRGEVLKDFLAQNNLVILNDDEYTATFHTIRNDRIYESKIDLTLCTLTASPLIKNWKVLSEESLSDHRLIYFEISDSLQSVKFKTTFKFNTKRADWDQFDELIVNKHNFWDEKLHAINAVSDLESYIDDFSIELDDICMRAIPKYNNTFNNKSNKWWNDELTKLRQKTNNLRRKYQRCQTDRRQSLASNYINFREKYKKVINERKQKSWENFVTESTAENA